MNAISHANAYQVLLLQAADNGRGPVLFGDSVERARTALLPFLVGEKFPSIYFEHPLLGEPFLDVTVLYGNLEAGVHIESDMAAQTDELLDWFADTVGMDPGSNMSFGFELDTHDPCLPAAAVHFQPRAHAELVTPFCEVEGEPERAKLYLDQAKRMPEGWPLSFFGMFRGRPASPLRVCGYLDHGEVAACANDPHHLAKRFDEIGFCAYAPAMLEQVSKLMGLAPGSVDFQFDVYPDGSLGDVFAIDVQFDIDQPEEVAASFESGPAARIFEQLEAWGVADSRWKLAADAVFARSLPIELDDGKKGRYVFFLMPQWAKARWSAGVLQPAKLYHYATGKTLEKQEDA